MSDFDERLGRVLRDTVEGRGRPAASSLAGAGLGPRAFVAATERRAGERPRFGPIVAAAVLGAVVAAGLALWPALTTHPAPAARPAPAAAEAAPAAAPAARPARVDAAAQGHCTGSITVRMSFLRPFADASCRGAACAATAAGQATFEWI